MELTSKRCVHCKIPYDYQESGPGCMESTNDDRYCKTCKGVIDRALYDVPILREMRWVRRPHLQHQEFLPKSRPRTGVLWQIAPGGWSTYPVDFPNGSTGRSFRHCEQHGNHWIEESVEVDLTNDTEIGPWNNM